ncbi:tyrosine-type recombinase/integrase [Colwellia sp. KU-HH00111]|uniref:tyrosine-type recombinase/integrase n=1 Tax=Colwellia sp. KU-HH00111 TaxID=3127652 RepID=UPI00310BDBED
MKKNEKNPAIVFANSLGSKKSTKTTLRVIDYLCREYNKTDHNSLDWANFDYVELLKLRRKFIDKGLKTTSINSYISTLKSVSRESWRLHIIDTETYMRIKDIQGIKGHSDMTGRALSPTELNNAVNSTNNDIKSIRDSAVIAIGYGCGLRSFEIAQIELNDISRNKLIVYGKGRIVRNVYLPNFAVNALKRWLHIRGSKKGALFSSLTKNHRLLDHGISVRTVGDIIDKRCENIGIERFTPHDLRRSFATNLLSSGVDVFIVQKLMRHASINTTRIYDMRGEDAKMAAVEMLPF